MKKKNWNKKLNDAKDLPKIINLEGKASEKWGEGTMVIPAPIDVDNIMKSVPKGKLITTNELRKNLAKKYKTNIACPLTTGIFTWIAAFASEERLANKKKDITPYWRTLKSKGEINPKYPGGIEKQIKLLNDEGFQIYNKSSKYYVMNYEDYLVKI